jgi:crotonobetaine/carnitine-CoA ligase
MRCVLHSSLVGDASSRQIEGTIEQTSVGYRVRVVDDRDRDAPAGEMGELRILGERGLSPFPQYLGDPDALQAAFDEVGYFRFGARVRARASGAIESVDRAKDVIKVDGENVAATEVERMIATMPGVREVCIVSGPDAMLGEVAVAFVIRDEALGGEADALVETILDRCRQELSRFKVPREVLVVETLPRVSIGKVSKAESRAHLRVRASAA